jgi:DNA (cytosine-5)-methyltransferase 1
VTFLDLFSGIGAFALGLSRAGMTPVGFCEIDPFCRDVLSRHWPDVPILHDVRTAEFPNADVICGGFPCQDISIAGAGAGLAGERSGLWREVVRAVRMVRPRWLVLENVPMLLDRGLGTVLGDLAENGYDAEWDCVSAADIGASQNRERIWILANPNDSGFKGPVWAGQPHTPWNGDEAARGEPLRSACGYWPPGPRAVGDIPRMADGPADRVHRLKALGNSLVPQIPELIALAILDQQ